MRYVSLFSGIEAASVAWEPLGWEPVAFAEIEPFPCAVLEYRFPNVPNLGDVTKIDWGGFIERYGAVDIVCGGSPCQSFSIAGGRESLQGESALCFEYWRAVRDLRPPWFLWENVPGVFSTRDNAFGQFLGKMEELGYGMAWRTLDAQFFGVAQRRRRVFLVGHLGDMRAAAVLFERESVSGNTVPSRKKREELARAAEERPAFGFKYHQGAGAGGVGFERGQSPTLTADWHNPAICIQGDGSTSKNSHGGGTARKSATPSTASTDTLFPIDRGAFDSVICIQDGQANAGMSENVSMTLNAAHEQPIVCMSSDTSNAAIDEDVAGTLHVGGGLPLIAAALSARGTTRESATSTCRKGS